MVLYFWVFTFAIIIFVGVITFVSFDTPPSSNKYEHGVALLGGKDCFWSFGRAQLGPRLKG